MYINLTAGGAFQAEWEDWNRDHARDIVRQLPGFLRAQSFRLHPQYANFHPESAATRPPYTVINCFEVDDVGAEYILGTAPKAGDGPRAGTRPFPEPLGPHIADTYLFVPISPPFRSPNR